MKIPIITNAQDAEIRKFVMERSWHADSPKQCIDDVVQAFKISRDKAKAIVRDMYDKDTFPDLEAGASSRYPEDVENALGVEVPITTGDFVTYKPTTGAGFGSLVDQVLEIKSPKAKVSFPGKGTDWYYFEDLEASSKSNDELERVENPSWMMDEPIWKKAKEAVGPGNDDKHWATVTEVYKKMGGRVKR